MLRIYNDGGLASRLMLAADKYIEEYVYDDGESSADHVPTDFERTLLHDMLAGLFSDEEFSAILQEAARGMKAAGLDPEGNSKT